MRSVDAAILAAIQENQVAALDLVWVTAKDRDTGVPVSLGVWTGPDNRVINVVDALTGSTEARTFYGAGALVEISAIPLTSDISIRSVDVKLSQIATAVQVLVRDYDPAHAPVQIYRSYLSTDTMQPVAAAEARFVGYVDGSPIETPAEGQEGSCILRCVSTTRELTRTSSEVRSYDSQLQRSATDDFYRDTATVGEWDITWGTRRAKVGGNNKS